MTTKYDIKPVPAPRQVRSDRWKKRPCVMRYRAFRDEVRLLEITVKNYDEIHFGIPMPKSWSAAKKAKMVHMPHKQKPDLDNILKSLLDACHKDDSHIHNIYIAKQWSEKGYIEIWRDI